MSVHEPVVIERFGSWELVEGIHGRLLRTRRRQGPKPHLLMGVGAIGLAAGLHWTGRLELRPAAMIGAYGALVLLLGSRASRKAGYELRFGESELGWARSGDVMGKRWPLADLSHVEIMRPLSDLPVGARRKLRTRYQVAIRTRQGAALPLVLVFADESAAVRLATRIAEETDLELKAAPGARADAVRDAYS